jgi:ribosomal protein S6
MKEEIIDTEMDIELRDPRVYEIGYLLLPSLGAEGVADAVGEIKAKLTTLGAEHISEGEAQHIDLAYEMVKIINNQNTFLDTGYFGWLKFSINPEAIAGINKMLDNRPEVLRFLLNKTKREDTMMNAKPMATVEEPTAEEQTDDASDSEETVADTAVSEE